MIEIKNIQTFNAVMNNQYVILYFTATWCGPCKRISPEFVKLSEHYDNAFFCKIDVDTPENRPIIDKYDIQAMPTFMIFKNGVQVENFTGANVETLQHKVSLHFS